MSNRIEWTTTEQVERRHILKVVGPTTRDATEADLLALGYVPAERLAACEEAVRSRGQLLTEVLEALEKQRRILSESRERNEQLEREVAETKTKADREFDIGTGYHRRWQALASECDRLRAELSESRARLAALQTAVQRVCSGLASNCIGAETALMVLRDALSKLDAAQPAPPRAVDPDQVKREPGCQCHWEVGDSPCRVHGEEEPAPPEAKGEERAASAPARPWRVGRKQGRNIYLGDEYVAVAFSEVDAASIVSQLNTLTRPAHLEQQRAPAPSKAEQRRCVAGGPCQRDCTCPGCAIHNAEQAAAVKPSELSPLPWRAQEFDAGHFPVSDRDGDDVCACQTDADAAFIVHLANRWHAEQGGEGQ